MPVGRYEGATAPHRKEWEDKTFGLLQKEPYAGQFEFIEPREPAALTRPSDSITVTRNTVTRVRQRVGSTTPPAKTAALILAMETAVESCTLN